MAKKRGNNEGSITRRPDGRRMAQVTIGRDPALGHSNITITLNTYTHVSLDMEKQGAAALNTALTRGLQ